MPSASILIKPSSANCNMDCKYCFYKCLSSNREAYSLGFMSEETLESLIQNAIEYADDYLTFAYQGGEPLLAGIDFFKKAVGLQKKYLAIEREKHPGKQSLRIENTVQTNGLLINEEWASFFREHHFLVGISLDGPRKMHDGARLDPSGNGTFERIMKSIDTLKRYHVDFNILTVVTEKTAQNASALYKFYKRNHFTYIQLIPCMDEAKRQGTEDGSPYAVRSESYGRFLCEFFDLWYEDFRKGEIVDVRMFSNLAQMAVGYPPEECGMCGQCHCYFVVEGDGGVYPCDFYCMDEYRLGTVKDSFSELINSRTAEEFVAASVPAAHACTDCKFYSLCRGGCRRWREPLIDGKPGLNYLCEGYKLFFEHTWERIIKLGQTIIDPRARWNL